MKSPAVAGRGEAMLLKEFVQMVADVVPYAGQIAERTDQLAATSSSNKGIACQVSLTPDGHISAEPTAISLAFTITGTPF